MAHHDDLTFQQAHRPVRSGSRSPEIVVTVDDSRRVAAYLLAEGESGRTVVLCHPAPGAGTFDPDPLHTRSSGIALLGVDRPGYGRSDPVRDGEWATVSSAADDIAAVLQHTGAEPVGVAGWSAGGRIALALAARHPDLVDAVAVIGTPAPHDEVPWIPPDQEAAVETLRGTPAAEAHTAFARQFAAFASGSTGAGDALALLAVGRADEKALAQPGARERLTHMLASAFAQGTAGLASDILGYTLRPWGFEPDMVEAETLLLYGEDDPLAGPQHGTWWREQLLSATLEVVPAAGHLLALTVWGRALAHLAPGPGPHG